MRISRLAFKALQSVSPDKAAALAERLFFSVSQTHLPADCTAVLEEGTPFTVQVDGREIVAWSWGSGPVFTWSTDGGLGEGDSRDSSHPCSRRDIRW
jgi:hypothetical protein